MSLELAKDLFQQRSLWPFSWNKLGPGDQAQALHGLWQRWRGSELRRGVDEGAHVLVANETEGTGFGAEQTWEAGRGEGGGKDEGRPLMVQGRSSTSWGGRRGRVRSAHRHGGRDFAPLSLLLPKAGGVSKRPVLPCVWLFDFHKKLRVLLSRGPWSLSHPSPHFMDKETETQRGA